MTTTADAPAEEVPPAEREPSTRGSEFAPLLRAVRSAGYLGTRRLRYALVIGVDLVAFAGVWAAVYALGHTWWVLLLALPAALFTMRIIFIGHDVGHGQVARTSKVNDAMALVIGDLVTGIRSAWWVDKHSRHHANPNQIGRDPDVSAGVLAWTSQQAADRGRFGRWFARHQAQLYFPMLLLEALNLKISSFRGVRTVRDGALLCTHVVVYLGGLVLLLGPGRAAVFVVAHHALVGLHLGIAFAPNHKGMPMLNPASRPDFLSKQVLTSRNVSGGPVMDWFLGGLNHQVEHHLFPSMPRPNLRRSRHLVRAHCAAVGLPYASENLRASMVLTIRHLHAAGRRSPSDGA